MRRPSTQKAYEAFPDAAALEPQTRPSKRKKRSVRFSFRLTYNERARLYSAADNIPLGTYIKGRLFHDLPTSLRDIEKAVSNGTLP